MTTFGAELRPQLANPTWNLAARVQAFMEKCRQKQPDAGEVKISDEFSEDEIAVFMALGGLNLASTKNFIYEKDIEEFHLWADRRGRVGLHTKRQDDFSDDTTRETRAFLRFQNGEPVFLHLQTQRVRRLGAEVIVFDQETAHLRVSEAGVPNFVLEEISDIDSRLNDTTKFRRDLAA